MNFDAEVSNFITKLLNEETPHEKEPQKDLNYINNANEKSLKTAANIKQKYQDLKQKYDFQLIQIEKYTSTITDLKAQLAYNNEISQSEMKNLKSDFNQKVQNFQQITKQKIDQLLQEKHDLAIQNTEFASKFNQLQTENNSKVFEQNRDLNGELQSLKMNFEQKISAEKLKLKRKYQQEFEGKQEKILKQAEKDLAIKIEPQINNIIASHKLQIQQLQTDFQQEKLHLQQTYNDKLASELEDQRRILIKQNMDEIALINHNNIKNTQKSTENVENQLNYKLTQLNENNTLQLSNLRKQHQKDLDFQKQEFESKTLHLTERIQTLQNAGVKLSDDFTAMKSKFESRYNTELAEIRSSYREFASQLFKDQKRDILQGIKSEQEQQIKKIVIQMEQETLLRIQAIQSENGQKIVDIEGKRSISERNNQTLKIQLLEAQNELEMSKKQVIYKQKQISEINSELEEKLGVNQEFQMIKKEIQMMANEDQMSTVMNFMSRQKLREQGILQKVKEQIQAIVNEKDGQISELREQIGELKDENQRYQVMIMELNDVSVM